MWQEKIHQVVNILKASLKSKCDVNLISDYKVRIAGKTEIIDKINRDSIVKILTDLKLLYISSIRKEDEHGVSGLTYYIYGEQNEI
jgi:hypothetical protein